METLKSIRSRCVVWIFTCVRVLSSLLTVLGAFILLFLNEGRGIHTCDMLLESRELCIPLTSPDNASDTLNSKLIYVSGSISTVEPLQDQMYGVNSSAARLLRRVEMYQWMERIGRVWSDRLVSSDSFKHRSHDHSKVTPVRNAYWTAVTKLGAFSLSQEVLLKINEWKTVLLDPAAVCGNYSQVYNNIIYLGNPHNPQIGDVRVWYEYAGDATPGKEDQVSVVGQQSPGAVVTSFRAPSGYDVLFVVMEAISVDELFSRKHASNRYETWVLRGVGFFLSFLGFHMVAGNVIHFGWLPLAVVKELVVLRVWLLAFAVSTSLPLVVILLAWILYQPFVGLTIVFGACLSLALQKLKLSGRYNQQT